MINKLKTLICMTLMRLPMAGTLRGRFAVMALVSGFEFPMVKNHIYLSEKM